MELKQITVLLIIIKLLIFSDMCNFFTFIFLIFYLLINSANGLNNTTVRYDISSVNANLPKNDNKHIYGNFSASSIKDNILTVTINPNNLGIKRYIDVAVTAGDVFDKIYFRAKSIKQP